MSDYLLLKNRQECPVCRVRRKAFHNSECHNCGTMLFVSDINFRQFHDENPCEWWRFDYAKGWMHASQILIGEQALSRHVDLKPVKPNVKPVEERMAEARAEERAKMKIAKKNQVGFGKSITKL